MARLIYSTGASLDGYIDDAAGNFDWAAPDEEVHAYVNDREREIGTYLLGRRLYDTMAVWDTLDDPEPVMRDYAQIWHGIDKVVYSRTLAEARTARTRIEHDFDPTAVRAMKESSERDLGIGGAELAGQALAAGLVDELRLLVAPVLVGGGTRALPHGVNVALDLLGERRFAGGMVELHYRVGAR